MNTDMTDKPKGLCKVTSYAANGVTSLWVGCIEGDVPMYRALGFDMPLGSLLTWNKP